MNYNFDWTAVSGGSPFITISKYGIAFNSVAISKLNTPEKILIGFDEERFVLGIKEYRGEENTRPYEFARRIKSGWIRVGCAEFIKYLQTISDFNFIDEAKRYTPIFDKETNTMIVELIQNK